MSRRRLTRQQKARIAAIRERRLHQAQYETDNLHVSHDGPSREGTVVVRHGRSLVIADEERHLVNCQFRQNLGDIVCGDHVIWHSTGDGDGVVTAVRERTTLLSRPDYGGHEKPLAANLTQLVIVAAPSPAPTGYLLDQYLAAAEHFGLKAILVLNKSDLLEDVDHELLHRFETYARIGYPVLHVSTKQHSGEENLRSSLKDESSILVGQSGVGKSSLVNMLLPDLDVQTGALSKTSGLGKHTTSSAMLYFLPQGGTLIDSPGVRSFRLLITERAELEQGFREFAPFLGHCQFSDCRHEQEPGCALTEAVESGKIAGWRLNHFRLMAQALGKT
ncbi:MAG: small ribosomal subunit biogenesis GTPase RsgA [Gammaproteobacteria bacterium]|jgi:ribosome biogenesis GTPase / thiamine phosphate phosphatase